MWKKKWPLILAGACWLVVIGLRVDRFTARSEEKVHASLPAQTFVYVELRGAVNAPGIYKVAEHSRLFEVIHRAGGLSDDADISTLNQTQTVYDGWLIEIPSHTDQAASNGGKISLNHATASELETLPGIGPATAEAIIQARSERPFKTIEDLLDVPGIGAQTLANIETLITP